jgi:hypothetical protein
MKPKSHQLMLAILGADLNVSEVDFHRHMIERLESMGAVFYEVAPFPPPIDKNPRSRIKDDGTFAGSIHFTHSIIDTRSSDGRIKSGFLGAYRLIGFNSSFGISSIGFNSDFVPEYEFELQQLADGRVAFLKELLIPLNPNFAYVDASFGIPITDTRLERLELRHLFWVNYFGKQFIEKYGRDFFLNTPAWRVEEIGEGILIKVTQQFLTFANEAPKDTLKYMQQKFTGMRANRFIIPKSF